MEKNKQAVEERHCSLVGGAVNRLLVGRFDHLQVPAAELVAVEFVDLHEGFREAVLAEQVGNIGGSLAKLGFEPLYGVFVCFGLWNIGNLQTFHHTEAIPDLVAEVTSLLAEAIVVQDIVAGRCGKQNAHTHTICTVALNQVERVGTVAERFGHLTTEFVAHNTCEIYVLERHLALVLVARHDHSCYPEEDDIRACNEVSSGVVILQFFVFPGAVLHLLVFLDEKGDRP